MFELTFFPVPVVVVLCAVFQWAFIRVLDARIGLIGEDGELLEAKCDINNHHIHKK